MYLRPGRRYHAVSPALGCHLTFIGWMNPWSLRGVFPGWGIYDLLLKLHIHQQLWELTRLQPELSRAGPHLLQPSLPRNLHLGTPWAGLFVPWFPGSAAGAVGWGGGGGRSRKSVGGSCLLVPKASKAGTAPSSQLDASPNSHTGVSANKANFFPPICS